MSGPYLEDKLASVRETEGKARCTTKQLKERPGCVIDVDGKQAVVRSMAVSYWQLVAKDVWEKVE